MIILYKINLYFVQKIFYDNMTPTIYSISMGESLIKIAKLHDSILAPYAVKNSSSKGRFHDEPNDTTRLPYQRDRDRIIYSKSFLRTSGKTQVFEAYRDDHDVHRMPHELQVGVVGRSIGRRLHANEDLIEAIALGHDLGHTPWGHSGEEALNKKMKEINPSLEFEHNKQSLRVVDFIDKLNLTQETREGLMKHQSSYDNPNITFKQSPHIEAQIVDIADEIAYTGHDLRDGLRSGILKLEDVEKLDLWKIVQKNINEKSDIQRSISGIIGYLIDDVCEQTIQKINKNKIDSVQKVRDFDGKLVDFSPAVKNMVKQSGEFLRRNFYFHPDVQKAQQQGQKIIGDLFDFYYQDTSKLPQEYREMIINGEKSAVVVADYIAGMTERFAKNEWLTNHL